MFSPFLIGMRTEGEKSRFFSPSIAKKPPFGMRPKRESLSVACVF